MELTHFNEDGRARMVDVTEKAITERVATAVGEILLGNVIVDAVTGGRIKKGDVLSVAQVAGIMGAKRTQDLIPMCHPIFLTGADIKFEVLEDKILIKATVKTEGKTGVEMEALTAVSVAALTIYDMVKAMGKTMVIGNIRLISKSGGKSGDYRADQEKVGE
jgi:cyclic pyranopterin monophosphate synthase